MDLVILGTAFALSVATTIALTPILGSVAIRRGWLDRPDTVRKLHQHAVPPVGGIGIFAGFTVGLLYVLAFKSDLPFEVPPMPAVLILALGIMVATGFYDDIKGLGFKGKFVIQLAVAYLLVHAGYKIDVSALPFMTDDPYAQALVSIPLTMLWIVGTINAVNLIDGLDGLAGGVVLIAFACLGVIFGINGEVGLIVYALVVAGALLGFLAHNFNPASVFMGDAGSLFLGCLLAVFSLSGTAHTDPVLALMIPGVALGLPLIDTALSIVRRVARGTSVWAPDRDHIHHRLARIWPQWQAVLVLYAAAALFGIAAILMSIFAPVVGFSVFAITAVASGAGLALLGYLRLRTVATDSAANAPQTGVAEQAQPAVAGAAVAVEARTHEAVTLADVEDLVVRPEGIVRRTQTETSLDDAARKAAEAAHRRRIKQLSLGTREQMNAILTMISRSSVIQAAGDLCVADLGGDAVVLDSNGGRYYGLNEVAARILELVKEPRSVGDVVALMRQEYDVPDEVLEKDVIQFLEEMEDHDLVLVE
ncbi:MAG TPA: PqqD family peptide modification chaperone, partial [Rhodothermales bacterium]